MRGRKLLPLRESRAMWFGVCRVDAPKGNMPPRALGDGEIRGSMEFGGFLVGF